jgi:hypothetical protein
MEMTLVSNSEKTTWLMFQTWWLHSKDGYACKFRISQRWTFYHPSVNEIKDAIRISPSPS